MLSKNASNDLTKCLDFFSFLFFFCLFFTFYIYSNFNVSCKPTRDTSKLVSDMSSTFSHRRPLNISKVILVCLYACSPKAPELRMSGGFRYPFIMRTLTIWNFKNAFFHFSRSENQVVCSLLPPQSREPPQVFAGGTRVQSFRWNKKQKQQSTKLKVEGSGFFLVARMKWFSTDGHWIPCPHRKFDVCHELLASCDVVNAEYLKQREHGSVCLWLCHFANSSCWLSSGVDDKTLRCPTRTVDYDCTGARVQD